MCLISILYSPIGSSLRQGVVPTFSPFKNTSQLSNSFSTRKVPVIAFNSAKSTLMESPSINSNDLDNVWYPSLLTSTVHLPGIIKPVHLPKPFCSLLTEIDASLVLHDTVTFAKYSVKSKSIVFAFLSILTA